MKRDTEIDPDMQFLNEDQAESSFNDLDELQIQMDSNQRNGKKSFSKITMKLRNFKEDRAIYSPHRGGAESEQETFDEQKQHKAFK